MHTIHLDFYHTQNLILHTKCIQNTFTIRYAMYFHYTNILTNSVTHKISKSHKHTLGLDFSHTQVLQEKCYIN